MYPVAVCRICVVETNPNTKLLPSCQYQVTDGIKFATQKTSKRVKQAVRNLTELLMADHPTPCEKERRYPGSCELERLARQFEVPASRFVRRQPTALPQDDSSLVIKVDHNACILCDRCVRGCDDIRNNFVIGRMGKGYKSRISFDLDDLMGSSSCVACGECMVSCPTGALTNRAAVEAKPWDDADPAPTPVRVEELINHPIPDIRDAFAGVSRPFLEFNANAVVRRRFKRGQVICKEGEFGSSAFLIERGSVQIFIGAPRKHAKAYKDRSKGARINRGLFGLVRSFTVGLVGRDDDDREEENHRRSYIPTDAGGGMALNYDDPTATLHAGDIFGEMTCMNSYPRSATVRAAEDCTVLELLRSVLYIMQRSRTYRAVLERNYRERAINNHLSSVPIFAGLRRDSAEFDTFVESLRPKVRLVRADPGDVIVRQGDNADDGFYMVRTGFVKVVRDQLGGQRVLNYIGPGGFFGEIALMQDLPEVREFAEHLPGAGNLLTSGRTATCSALDHVDLVQINPKDFRELLDRFPQVRSSVVAQAKQRIEELVAQEQRSGAMPLADFVKQGLYEANSLLVLDLQKCTRCDECTKACSDAHDGVTRLIREGLRFDKFLVASSCRSCLDPYCMVGCPVGSIRRRESKEIIIEDWCIGCGKCAENCPYGNINMHPFPTGEYAPDPENEKKMKAVVQQKATACDLCRDVGGEPSCVYACPHDAAHRMTGRELRHLVEDLHIS
jgi:CRP-like cAMP-binding protein/Fe-S-cluster-containing hydrogenase component 2